MPFWTGTVNDIFGPNDIVASGDLLFGIRYSVAPVMVQFWQGAAERELTSASK